MPCHCQTEPECRAYGIRNSGNEEECDLTGILAEAAAASLPYSVSAEDASSSRLFVGRREPYHGKHVKTQESSTPQSQRLKISRPVRTVAPVRGQPAQNQTDLFQSSLARLLGTAPARVVPHLAPETLHRLIRQAGLKPAGLASATPEQLLSVFDFDLWRSARPGLDEEFDADRFGEWIELLVETDGAVAARIVASQDEHLVIAGLSRYVRVFDLPAIALPASLDDEPADLEMAPGGSECEVGGYLVRAIRADAWDAIVGLHRRRLFGLLSRADAMSPVVQLRRKSTACDLLMEPTNSSTTWHSAGSADDPTRVAAHGLTRGLSDGSNVNASSRAHRLKPDRGGAFARRPGRGRATTTLRAFHGSPRSRRPRHANRPRGD